MNEHIRLDEEVLEKIKKNTSSFIGSVIDISGVSDTFASHLDVEWANSLGVTKQDLAIQVVENRIRKFSTGAGIQVICFFKEQVEKETALVEQLRQGRIILLK